MTRSKHAALAALILTASPMAHALQTVTARDGETVFAKIAQKEITRIAVESGRIRKVTGNTGEFTVEKDEDRGQIFIRPIDPQSTKPINLFVATDHGTVGLLLQPVDAPSDSIVIRDRENTRPIRPDLTTASRHIRVLKNMLLALATDAMPDDLDRRESATELAFWPGLRMTRIRTYVGATLVGEKYLLANQTDAPIRLEPSHLYKRGVLAIAVESPDIAPGDATPVFVIRERQSHD